jgi:Rha family phage regulatory protein
MKQQETDIHVFQKHGQLFTTSIDVAEKFGKQHAHVMRSIRSIVAGLEEAGESIFGASNFKERSYISDQEKRLPMYEMTKSGF